MHDDNQNPEHSSNLPAKRTDAAVPKPYRVRHDGWTAERKTAFIDTLTRTGCVRDACRVAGISSTSAYRYRQRDAAFDDRWAMALRRADTTLDEVAWKRAVEGEEEDVWYHGKVVGTRVKKANDVLRLLIQRDDNGAGRDAAGRFVPADSSANIAAGAEVSGQFRGDQKRIGTGPTASLALPYGDFTTPPHPEPPPGAPRDTLDDKLKKISARIGETGNRNINIRTNQGITDEVIEAVQRFVAGGRVMLPAKYKWLKPENFEKAKADFLAQYPGGVPEGREEEFRQA